MQTLIGGLILLIIVAAVLDAFGIYILGAGGIWGLWKIYSYIKTRKKIKLREQEEEEYRIRAKEKVEMERLRATRVAEMNEEERVLEGLLK